MWLRFFYLFLFLFTLTIMIFYYETDRIKINKNILLFIIFSIITNYGQSMGSFSLTKEAMICGNQIAGIGYIYCTYFMLSIVIELCNVKFLPRFRIPLLILTFILSALMITADSNGIVYKSISTQVYKGIELLALENGPIHYIFILFLVGCNFGCYGVVIYTIISKAKVSKRTLIAICIIILLGSSTYILGAILRLPYNLIPLVYAITDFFLFIFSKRISLYNISSALINSYEQKSNTGYLVFDKTFRFMCCDDFSLKVFPFLNNINVDSLIPHSCRDFQKKVMFYLRRWHGDTEREYHCESNKYNIVFSIKAIKISGKTKGYLIEVRDQTQIVKSINSIEKYTKQLAIEAKKIEDTYMQMQDDIMQGMAVMIDRRDNNTGDHIKRTSGCVRIFMEELELHPEFEWCTQEFIDYMIKAAPLHDLGKIAVDDAILRKTGRFEPEERKMMETHPKEGYNIVHDILRSMKNKKFKKIAENVAHYHHEKWDGTGYPDKKKGENIPIEARIMALADVFDALVSKRCYKDAFDMEDAFKIIEQDLNTHFDPILGKIFLQCKPKLKEFYSKAIIT